MREERKKKQQQDHQFYMEIWMLRTHKCYCCGKPLYGEPLTIYFHHVLPKAKFPQYRHCKVNIVLVCWNCHGQAESNLDKVPRLREYTNKLLAMHDEGTLCTET